MMQACERALAQGCSIYFFPEGTRSRSGQLKPFKPGAFILARQARVPILPVVIDGTRAALPKYSLNFHGRHDLQIKVLDPISPAEFADLTVDQISEMVRQRIADQLSEPQPPPV
jgi:1-acyl-sn-glycerol-3-phosphate acyltransferase